MNNEHALRQHASRAAGKCVKGKVDRQGENSSAAATKNNAFARIEDVLARSDGIVHFLAACGPRGRTAHRTQLTRTASSGALLARVLRQVVRASTDAPVRPSSRGGHHEFAARTSVTRRCFGGRAPDTSANDHILWPLRTTYQQFVEVLRICELVPRAEEMEGFQEASDVARSNNLRSYPSAAASGFVRQCVTGHDRRLAPSYGPATIAQQIGCYEQAGDDLLE